MIPKILYIVTHYGCNSSPSSMWIPRSKLFTNYQTAYDYFVKISPPLIDPYNAATQYVNNNEEQLDNQYIIIENRLQLSGYHDGEPGIYSKRPEGVVLAKIVSLSQL